MWEIKGKDNQTKATVHSVEYNDKWMEERYVTVSIESPAPINFAIGDYLTYRSERFEINYDPGKIKSAPRFVKGDAFKYENVKFNALDDELTRCDFLDVVLDDNQLHFTGLPKFSFYGGVQDLANRIQANLNRAYPNQWTVVVSFEYTDKKELNVSVDNIKVQGALEILVNQFETYYTIKGRTITIGAAGIPAGHLFKYGKGNGLYEIEQNAEADQAIVTRLRAYGSTRNLPHRYYNSLTGADGKKLIPDNMAVQNLMLPEFPYTTQDPYIDSANKAAIGIREGTIFFDGSQEGLEEIYPSIEGMTAEDLHKAGVPCNSTGALDEIVSAEQMTDDGVGEINESGTQTTANPSTFKVAVKDLGFDINDHLTSEAATISFKTGMLGGRDFEIVENGCKPIKNASGAVTGYELELNRVYDDGIKLRFPYKDYNAKPGDKFVVLHIEMPEVYIKAAAQRLKEAAEAWLAKNDYSRSIYAPKIDELFMARQHDVAMASGGTIKSLHDTICAGMLLLFEDEDLNIDASIFIDSLTIREGDSPVPTYEVVLKEEKTVGRLDKMQNQIDSLVSGKGQGGTGGYTASQIRSMIEAYGGSVFLSKLKNDRSAGIVASDKGFEVGQFTSGVSGGMLGIDPTSGDSFAEVARLYVRVKAFFEELMVVKAGVLAGKQYITPGGGIKCVRVEENGMVEASLPLRLENGGAILKEDGGSIASESTYQVDNGVPAGVYRCYFLSEQDGEKTECKFVAGDQAISEMFNAKAGVSNQVSNHRYWRLVVSVNNDAYVDDYGNHYGYIDLSKADCEADSDIPKAGDEICQLGNRDDADRQAAMIFSTVDADAPSIKMFAGVGTGTTTAQRFSLEGKDLIAFSKNPTTGDAYFKCYGDMFVGAPDESTFIRYNKADKEMTAKLKLDLQSTVGTDGKTLGDVVSGAEAAGYSLQIDNQVAGVACDAEGNPTGALPRCQLSVWHGTQKVTDGVVYSVEEATGVSASVSFDRGLVTFSSMTADTASVSVRAEVAGVALTGTISLYKQRPGADGGEAVVYSLLASVGNVLRDADGTATPGEVECSKYRTDSTGTAKTGDMWLYVRRYSGETPSAWSLLAGPGTQSGSVAVADGVTAVEFELRDGSGARPVVLDKQMVRVLTDASGLLIGGTNLLTGTNRGTEGWIANTSADGKVALAEMTIEGTRGLQVGNLSSVVSPQYRMLMREVPSDLFKSGKRYTLSFDAWCSAGGVPFSVDAGLSTGDDPLTEASPWHYFPTSDSLSAAGIKRVVVPLTGSGPGTSSGQHYLKINIIPGTEWQSIYIGNLKLEEGNVATEWSPAPTDPTDYITASIRDARKESGSFDGGLILATLMRLGFTDADGVYKVRSGISGIADRPEAPAIWMGGDMVDAENNPSGLDPATAMLRHNGTGYFCGNTIRMEENRMEVGRKAEDGEEADTVVLDDSGLSLNIGGNRRLAIANAPVGDDFPAADQTSADLTYTGNSPVKFSRGQSPYTDPMRLYVSEDFSVGIPITDKNLVAGTQVSFTISFVVNLQVIKPTNGTTPMRPSAETGQVRFELLQNGVVRNSATPSSAWTKVIDVDDHAVWSRGGRATFNTIVADGREGAYSVRVRVDKALGTSTGTYATPNAAITRTGSVRWNYASQTVLGNDGLLSIWGDAALLVKQHHVGGLVGNYGLKATDQGFFFTTTAGREWKQIDFTKIIKTS